MSIIAVSSTSIRTVLSRGLLHLDGTFMGKSYSSWSMIYIRRRCTDGMRYCKAKVIQTRTFCFSVKLEVRFALPFFISHSPVFGEPRFLVFSHVNFAYMPLIANLSFRAKTKQLHV